MERGCKGIYVSVVLMYGRCEGVRIADVFDLDGRHPDGRAVSGEWICSSNLNAFMVRH